MSLAHFDCAVFLLEIPEWWYMLACTQALCLVFFTTYQLATPKTHAAEDE